MVFQKTIQLPPFAKGFHLITDKILRYIPNVNGIVQVLIQHTSASLTINENADPTVRMDFETFFNNLVSEDNSNFLHTDEGPDDMTSHIKSSLLGSSVSFPIKNGKPEWGLWQGIYLYEHRKNPRKRNLFITVIGEK